jgi:hypothetical protein
MRYFSIDALGQDRNLKLGDAQHLDAIYVP